MIDSIIIWYQKTGQEAELAQLHTQTDVSIRDRLLGFCSLING